MTNKEIFRETAKLLKTQGWCQRSGLTTSGKMCLLYALRKVVTDPLKYERAQMELQKLIPPRFHNSIIGFNDHLDTQFEDVLELLKKAEAA